MRAVDRARVYAEGGRQGRRERRGARSERDRLCGTGGIGSGTRCRVERVEHLGRWSAYWELEVGPLGHFLDIAIDRNAKKSDVAWSSHSKITTKVDRDKKHVTIDVAVRSPDVLAVLKRGARLPLGLYRMEGKAPNRLFLAWSPTKTPKPDFHVPSMFGTLVLD